ncbi:MAG: MFS transporter [Candidatus Bathyarchaeota archaeon]|nr:MFS transporter [Candidatus Bathyarchaeota archaeon]
MEYKWTVLTVTTVGVLMSGLDTRIVIIGLPQVAAALGADAEQAIWFTQAYVLCSTISLLLIGRATDIIGRVKIYTAGFGVFTIGSLLVSLAQNPAQVIVFRGLQGIGGAMLMTNSAAMIVDATPKKELGLALGINQIALRFGMMGGLTLSGIILAFLDWRALFYINIPIGIFGTVWAQRRLKEIARTEKGAPMDWVGFLCFTTSIVSLLLALTFDAYGMTDRSLVYGLLVVTAVGFAAFIAQERKHSHPLLDLRIMGIKEFTGGVTAQFLNSIAWGAVALLLSLYFQLVLGLSPFDAGIRILPIDLAFLLVGPLSGRLSDKYGHMPFTTTGLALSSTSLFLFSTTNASTPYSLIFVYLAMFGAGVGLFSSPNMSSLMGSVPTSRRGIASAVRAVFFQTGSVISINLAILVMTFTVPYRIVSGVISTHTAMTAAETALFAGGINNAYLWMAAINALAIIPSLLRGKRVEETGGLTKEDLGDDAI